MKKNKINKINFKKNKSFLMISSILGVSLCIAPLFYASTNLGVANSQQISNVSNYASSSTVDSSKVRTPSVAQNTFVTNTTDVATATKSVFENNLSSANMYTVQGNSIMQNTATDLTSTGYALFTNSSATSAGQKYDQITKFATQTIFNGDITGTKNVYAGQVEWIVSLSDLAPLIDTSVTATDLTFQSMIFNLGGLQVFPALFVLVHSTNATYPGSYVFKINWQYNSTTITTAPKPGAYALFNKISSSVAVDYNFMSLDAASTSSIQVFNVPKLDPAVANQQISFTIVSESTAAATTFTPTVYKYLMPTDYATLYYKSVPTYITRNGVTVYIFYQNETAKSSEASKAGFWIQLPPFDTTTSASTQISLTSANFKILDLSAYYTDSTFQDNTTIPLSFNLINSTTSTSYSFLVTQTTKAIVPTEVAGTTNFLAISFDIQSMFSSSSPTNYAITKQQINGTNLYIKSIVKVFDSSSSTSYSNYYILDSTNKVYITDLNFKINSLIYDIQNSSIVIGDVPLLFTMPGSSSWMALLTDCTFVVFNASLLVGRWDAISTQASYEIPLQFNILNNNQIAASVIYQQVMDGSIYATTFTGFLGATTAYQSFMTVLASDPRLGAVLPKVTISVQDVSQITTVGNSYTIELTFTQNLRKINSDGTIDTSGAEKQIQLFKQKYTFINDVGSITAKTIDQVPQFIKSKSPSQLTTTEIQQYLLSYTNVPTFQILTSPNDQLGILNLQITVPFIWQTNGGTNFLNQNYVYNFTFGDSTTPFFATNPLLGKDASVTIVDQNYTDSNPTTLSSLKLKYSSVLPSTLTYDKVLSDFLILGSAFYDNNLITSGVIKSLTANDVTIVPFDRQGNALIKIVFPKIGNNLNVEYLYYTPSVFLVDPTAQEIAYFAFKSNDEVINSNITGTTTKLSTLNPSKIAQQLNSTLSYQLQINTLKYFSVFSNYIERLIYESSFTSTNLLKITATPNDSVGTLQINIKLLDALPGSNITSFDYNFSGFATKGTPSTSTPTFSFNNITSTTLLSKNPSSITSQDLIDNNALSFNTTASSLPYFITLTPLDTDGILQVSVVFYNWYDSSSSTTLPIKEFVHSYSGFAKTKPPVNSIVWKSFNEITSNPLFANFPNILPSVASTQITSNSSFTTNLSKLQIFANISNELLTYLTNNDSKITLNIISDDATGGLTISLQISGFFTPNSVFATENSIYGFQISNPTYSVQFQANTSSSAQLLKNKMPSELTTAEIESLFTINNYTNVSKKITTDVNDIDGTLTIHVEFYDSTSNQLISSSSQTYVDFKKFVPPTQSINAGIIVLLAIIPLVVLLIPVILISVLKNRRQVKKIAKKIDSRLSEIYKKDQNNDDSEDDKNEF